MEHEDLVVEVRKLVDYCNDDWTTDRMESKRINEFIDKINGFELPRIPKDVAEQIERVKKTHGNYTSVGLFDANYDKKPEYAKWIHDNIHDFMKACVIGYALEEEPRFYLKNKLTGDYLSVAKETGEFFHTSKPINEDEPEYGRSVYDEVDADAINEGSYEKVEV